MMRNDSKFRNQLCEEISNKIKFETINPFFQFTREIRRPFHPMAYRQRLQR